MSNFKTIEKLGLEVRTIAGCEVIFAREIENLLQSAQVVYGNIEDYGWSRKLIDTDTHRALLLCVEPLKKKTRAEAALEFVESLAKDTTKFWNVATLDEAKRILEMKDEV